MEWLFGISLACGAIYMVVSLLIGDLLDLDLDLDFLESLNLSSSVIAVFLVVFGALGLVATLNDVPPIGAVLGSLVFAGLVARLVAAGLDYLRGQEYTSVTSAEKLIGKTARATINIPAGKIGEGMIEAQETLKYAIKEIDGLPLQRGDLTVVVEINAGYALVQKLPE